MVSAKVQCNFANSGEILLGRSQWSAIEILKLEDDKECYLESNLEHNLVFDILLQSAVLKWCAMGSLIGRKNGK